MKKIKIILLLLLFLNLKIYSQVNQNNNNFHSLNSEIDNTQKPIISGEEEYFLVKKGLLENYKWDNKEANLILNYALEMRKISNTLFYSSLGLYSVSLIFSTIGFLSKDDFIPYQIGATTFSIGLVAVIPALILRKKAVNSVFKARMKIKR